MAGANYSATIEAMSEGITKKEAIKAKDFTNAISLDEVVTPEGKFVITPAGYVVVKVHNDKADRPDYNKYVIFDKDGNKYVTGSDSFWESFHDICSDMEGEEFDIEIYKVESKNYKGKHFLTCSLA